MNPLVFWFNNLPLVAIGPRTLFASTHTVIGATGVTIGDISGPRPDLYPKWTNPVVPGQIQLPDSGFSIRVQLDEGGSTYFLTDRPVPPEAIHEVMPTPSPMGVASSSTVTVWWQIPSTRKVMVANVQPRVVGSELSLPFDYALGFETPSGSMVWDTLTGKFIGTVSFRDGPQSVLVSRARALSTSLPIYIPPSPGLPPWVPPPVILPQFPTGNPVALQNQLDAVTLLLLQAQSKVNAALAAVEKVRNV